MPAKPLKIGILECGRPVDEVVRNHGSYPEIFERWLNPLNGEFQSFAVLDGILPDNPMVCDLWVITGSRFAAYEDHTWIPLLETFIRDCRDAGQKMVGICFGHQIIARALGGVVEKSDKGWGLGVHDYTTSGWPGFDNAPSPSLKLQAYHQDQVLRLPDGAKNIATSDFCENAALWYPGFALTVQGHPEMYSELVLDLLGSSRSAKLGQDVLANARLTVGNETTSGALAVYLRDNIDLI